MSRCPAGETIGRGRERVRAGATIPATTGFCPACASDIAHTIAWLPRDYVDLIADVGRDASFQPGERVGGSRELPIPLRTGIDALAVEIADTLVLWAEPVATQLQVPWSPDRARTGRRGPGVDRAAELLSRHMSVLVALPPAIRASWNGDDGWTWNELDGPDGALELAELHHRAQQALGRTRLVHRLPLPCPECDIRALVRHDGDDQVRCQACGVSRAWEAYEHRVSSFVTERAAG